MKEEQRLEERIVSSLSGTRCSKVPNLHTACWSVESPSFASARVSLNTKGHCCLRLLKLLPNQRKLASLLPTASHRKATPR